MLSLLRWGVVALGEWLWEENHVDEVTGLNPNTRYYMDIWFVMVIFCLFEKDSKYNIVNYLKKFVKISN